MGPIETKHRGTALLCLLLAAMAAAVYHPVVLSDFLNYDDNILITANPHIAEGLSLESVRWAFTETYAYNWIPLSWLSHMLDVQIFGMDPWGHHLVNLLFHAANGVLLFLVLGLMTGARWRSFFVAALFVVHPMHVESVAWAAERRDVLSTFFWLLTMGCYSRYAERRRWGMYSATLICFALGLLAKPMLVTLPFVLLLLDWWPLGRVMRGGVGSADHLGRYEPVSLPILFLEKVPLLAMAAGSSFMTLFAQTEGGAVATFESIPMAARFSNALVSYVSYLGKMAVPRKMAVFYPHQGSDLSAWQAVFSVLAMVVITGVVLKLGQKYRYLIVGWFWYLGTLVPVIGVVQVGAQSMADRYTYVPYVGLFIALSWGVCDLKERSRRLEKALPAVIGAAGLGLMVVAYVQVGHWRNGVTLFEHAVAVTEDNAVAYGALGVALSEQGRGKEGVEKLQKALSISPFDVETYILLGNIYSSMQEYRAAAEAYEKAGMIKPGYEKASNNLGETYLEMGKYREAVEVFTKAIRIGPAMPELYYNLGNALSELGDHQSALDAYNNAVRLRGDYAEAYNNMAISYDRLGRYREAVASYELAVSARKDYAEAYYNLGFLHLNYGNTAEVRKVHDKLSKMDPPLARDLEKFIRYME